jgi:hypothetical protein
VVGSGGGGFAGVLLVSQIWCDLFDGGMFLADSFLKAQMRRFS